MVRPYLTDLEEENTIKARPAIPIIQPAAAPAAPGAGQPPARPPLTPGAEFGGLADQTQNAMTMGNYPMPGGAPPPLALNPMSTASPQEMAAADPNSAMNVQRRLASPNPMISGPEQDTSQMQNRMALVNGINSGQTGYVDAVRGGMAPAQATSMGLVAPYPQVTAPNLAYGGANITPRPQATGMFAPPMPPETAQATLDVSAPGTPMAKGSYAPAAANRAGKRTDESEDQFKQRLADIATMNMENATLGTRRSDTAQEKLGLRRAATSLMLAGDTKGATALLSQGAAIKAPDRSTPASVAQARRDEETKRLAVGSDPKLQVSRDTTERERMRQEGLNTRASQKRDFDERMVTNKARIEQLAEADKTKAKALLTRIENLGRRQYTQEGFVGGKKSAEALQRIADLEKELEALMPKAAPAAAPATTPAAAAPIGTMNGKPVTEADIETTMKARNMTREQVLAEIAKRGFTSNAR